MTEEVNAAAEEAAPQLTLGDISTMVQIIDLCSKRGGFEGPELKKLKQKLEGSFGSHSYFLL